LDFLILAKSFLIVNQSPLFLKNQSWYSLLHNLTHLTSI